MMPTDFDSAIAKYLSRPVTPSEGTAISGLGGLGRVTTSRFLAEAIPFLGMPLDEFQAKGALLEVRVPGLNVTLWMVPAEREVTVLLAEGVSRGRIWTVSELMNFMAIADRTPQTVKTLARAKLEFDGEITEVRRRGD